MFDTIRSGFSLNGLARYFPKDLRSKREIHTGFVEGREPEKAREYIRENPDLQNYYRELTAGFFVRLGIGGIHYVLENIDCFEESLRDILEEESRPSN